MRERLREVAEHAVVVRVVFFRKKADIVADRHKPFEQFAGPIMLAQEGIVAHEPEAARYRNAPSPGGRLSSTCSLR